MSLAGPLRFGSVFVFALVSMVFASCSNGTDDSLINACKVIVETCHRGPSVGECVDDMASLSPDCVACVGAHGCDYSKCQAEVMSCRIPERLLATADRLDAGLR